MRTLFFVLAAACLLVSCGISADEHSKLLLEKQAIERELENCQQTPETLVQKFNEALASGDKKLAETYAEQFKLKFKDDPKGSELKAFLQSIKDSISNHKADEEKASREAQKNIISRYDEFNGVTWKRHRSNSKYNQANELSVYFGIKDSVVMPLRAEIKYTSDEWLFVRRVEILADGAKLEVAGDFERDNGSGSIWEWLDWQPSQNEITFFKKIANSKVVKVRYVGDQYYNDRTVTAKEKMAIKEMTIAYKQLGGQ